MSLQAESTPPAVERCEQCGFVWDDVAADELAVRMLAASAHYRILFAQAAAPGRADGSSALTQRPAPGTWSAVEYTCHVRDMMLVQRDRLVVGLVQDRPDFTPMWRDHRVELLRYNDQDPWSALAELETAVRMTARAFGLQTVERLQRPCVYNYPETQVRTLRWVGAQCVHELEHHAIDIAAGLRTIAIAVSPCAEPGSQP
jgi:S-DNA-T family DNA segregation ATPase FtsK/SpoIIIE